MTANAPQSAPNVLLLSGGIACIAIALLHVLIIGIGADAYRFFGAGEAFAVMAEQGSLYPGFLTAGIAAIFAVWGWYGLSGAGFVRSLPFCRIVLISIGSIFLLRAIAMLPLLFMLESAHAAELRERPLFSVLTSLLSLFIGLAYLIGSRSLKKRSGMLR